MWRKAVGVWAALALGAMLTFGAVVAYSESLTWTPATTTVDGTSFTSAEIATMTFYVRIDKSNPRDTTGVVGSTATWYYLGETRNGGSSFPADNSLASLMRSYGFSGQTVRFTVSQAFKDTDGVERDSVRSPDLAWIVPMEGVLAASFSPVPGNFAAVQVVALSTATAGASIRFTTDGSTPSATVGTVYSAPIAVGAGTTTIKSIAYKSGMADSAVASGTYVVTLPFNPRTPAAPTGPVVR